ncbi:hypothetical protein L3Y34_005380 [Caenorhabditis briggsae]|uniref:Uncharacterized protein n=1 Tax=Caenorhabditis briggsae TaxID=6238 RepID=A0AAE9AEJ5_CAEBR|nr:hypothetical protein L3Y34_005380 [Caenorhabditis briggsae]
MKIVKFENQTDVSDGENKVVEMSDEEQQAADDDSHMEQQGGSHVTILKVRRDDDHEDFKDHLKTVRLIVDLLDGIVNDPHGPENFGDMLESLSTHQNWILVNLSDHKNQRGEYCAIHGADDTVEQISLGTPESGAGNRHQVSDSLDRKRKKKKSVQHQGRDGEQLFWTMSSTS